ncbi:MAG: coproporphyrinogen dehydrogenase HemZ [Eubacteriales bacterium]|nr:coproporphyrinogen dehydrogenase HemZ [Eubacteriales bacterium]
MIYLLQNSKEYDYDVRAIALAFFEREKIKEISKEEWEQALVSEDLEESLVFMRFDYKEKRIDGEIFSKNGRRCSAFVECEYLDHEHHRNDVSRFLYRLFSDYAQRELPWGMLTGIRPTKIIMKWMEEDMDPASLEDRFAKTYLADEQKASLCRRVAFKEKKIIDSNPFEKEYSLYIGIPFCPTTCLYCSFTSFPASRFGDRMGPYLDALFKEMEYVSKACKHKTLSSIYVGGGTPTALDAPSLQRLMDKIHELFPVESVREFTVEAGRPDSITMEKMEILKKAGVERVSINPQTMHQCTLDLIGRAHTVEQTKEAFRMAREAGFDVINMDIITGLPGEDVTHIRQTLNETFEMKPDNLTVHSLAIKRAANLNIEMEKYRSLVKGSTNEMLRLVDEACIEMNMEPYYMYRQKNIPGNLENIGYSVPGKEGLYNILIMEEKQDIIACGAGASTKYVFPEENRIERSENVKNLDHYIQRIDEMIDRKRAFLDR